MSTKSKFALMMVLVSLMGAVVFGLLSYLESRESLREAAFEEMTAIRTARAQQVNEFFVSVFDEASVITENPTVSRALVAFRDSFEDLEATETLDDIAFQDGLETYYEESLIPQIIAPNIERGEADTDAFMPKSRAGRYLQYRYLAENPNPYDDFDRLTETDGPTRYERVHAEFHEAMRFIRDEFGYYDIILIDAATGDIVYSVDKEADFGTNIYTGPFRGSGLGDLVEKVVDDPTRRAVHFQDLQYYLPSSGKPALFVGSSIYEGGVVAGILAIQLTNAQINNIMTAQGNWKTVGLKDTGETYLVGADGTLRNESRFFIEDPEGYFAVLQGTATPPDAIERMRETGTSVLSQRVDTEAFREAMAGRTDTRIIEDYRGEPVLSAYQPVRLDGKPYALIAEIDAAEAFAPVDRLLQRTAITTALVIPLTAILGIFIGNWLMRPADRMRETARAFANGREDVQFADADPDEWARLGAPLNDVLDIARDRQTRLQAASSETSDMTRRLMPYAIGERFAAGERDIVSHSDSASAAILRIEGAEAFNDLTAPERARQLYEVLDDRLDELATREGVDMLNQAGLHYAALCGLTTPLSNHGERLFRFVRDAGALLAAFNAEFGTRLTFATGFASGPLLGALIGNLSTAYEVWGEAVHEASALAALAPAGSLVIADDALEGIGASLTGEAVTSPSGVAALRVSDFAEVR